MNNYQSNSRMALKFAVRLVGFFILLVVVLIGLSFIVDIEDIEGYEVGVEYKWMGGIQDEYLKPGLNFVWLGKAHIVNVGMHKLTFADKECGIVPGSADMLPEYDFSPIKVNCGQGGGQSAWIHVSVLYNVKPEGAVKLWRGNIGKTYRYVLLKRVVVDAVNSNTRTKEALDIYSGEGYNDLQEAIEEDLKNDQKVAEVIDIHEVTIFQVRLEESYEKEIENKQLAKQKKLTAIEEAAAAEAEAERAKEYAQIEVQKRTAEAEAKKIEIVLAAEAKKQETVLYAEATKKESALEGEGQKLYDTYTAEGVKAYGLAQAQVEDAKKKAMYDGEAGLRKANVEVSQALAAELEGLLTNIKIIPTEAFVAITDEGKSVPFSLTDQGVRNTQKKATGTGK